MIWNRSIIQIWHFCSLWFSWTHVYMHSYLCGFFLHVDVTNIFLRSFHCKLNTFKASYSHEQKFSCIYLWVFFVYVVTTNFVFEALIANWTPLILLILMNRCLDDLYLCVFFLYVVIINFFLGRYNCKLDTFDFEWIDKYLLIRPTP